MTDRMTDRQMTEVSDQTMDQAGDDRWQQTACILCSINCGIEVQLDGRRFARIRGDKAHPALAGLHLREGAAPRPLPERRATA